MQGSFDCAGTSLREIPAPLRMTVWRGRLAEETPADLAEAADGCRAALAWTAGGGCLYATLDGRDARPSTSGRGLVDMANTGSALNIQ